MQYQYTNIKLAGTDFDRQKTAIESDGHRKETEIITHPQSQYNYIWREVPKCDGVYIEGKIQEVDVIFTADTGANCSIISKCVYSAIVETVRPPMQHSVVSNTLGANGQTLQ